MIWSCLKPSTLAVINQFTPIKDDVEFDTLVIKVLFRALSKAPAKSLSKRDCSGLANRIVDDLVTLSELPKMPQKAITALQETVTQRLLIYPDCDAKQPVFKYLDNNQPSFFIVADEDDNPPSQDNTSMYRSYYIAGDLPPKTYLLSDIATIFKVTSSAANCTHVAIHTELPPNAHHTKFRLIRQDRPWALDKRGLAHQSLEYLQTPFLAFHH